MSCVLCSRRFYIVNPTNNTYSIKWISEDSLDDPDAPSNFTCLTTEGVVESGKKFEVVFDYLSDESQLVESFWRFYIVEHNISVPFLLVGQSKEPAISLDRSHLNFRELLLGEYLV